MLNALDIGGALKHTFMRQYDWPIGFPVHCLLRNIYTELPVCWFELISSSNVKRKHCQWFNRWFEDLISIPDSSEYQILCILDCDKGGLRTFCNLSKLVGFSRDWDKLANLHSKCFYSAFPLQIS